MSLPEYEATLLDRLGERTIEDVGVKLSRFDPQVHKLTTALEDEMRSRGYVFNNEAVAYNVSMMGGTYTWVTLAPQYLLVRENPNEDDVYDVVGVTSGGFPALDTTDVGDAAEDANLGVTQAKAKRGEWRRHHGSCYAITGPTDATTKRFSRTVCYNVDHQELDTTKGTSYWQYHEDASGVGINGNKMYRIWVHADPYGHGTAVPHTDRQPSPNTTQYFSGPCETVTTTVKAESGAPVVVGISREWEKTTCKSAWYGPVVKGDGDHAAEWETTDNPAPSDHARAVSMVLPVHAATKDGSPIWNILSGQWVRY